VNPSTPDEVRKMYEETADSYAEMMDSEIGLPVYSDILGRLCERLLSIGGVLIDTACGSGHMLSMYFDHFDKSRQLLGVDLSPRMAAIAAKRLGSHGRVIVGDMRDLSEIEKGEASAVLSFFALHHLDPSGVREAFREWYRVLRPDGQLVVATWEGTGAVDYGDESDIVALKYSSQNLKGWVKSTGFEIARCVVEPVEEIPMDAIYLEGAKR
jgi:ubiquinone/menaquinone biosynthesis C-methylase UbiE